MAEQLYFEGFREQLKPGESWADMLKAEDVAMIRVAYQWLGRAQRLTSEGSSRVRELVRILFDVPFSNRKGLSRAITQVCIEPGTIRRELWAEAEALMPAYQAEADATLERASSKKGGSK